MIKFQNFLFVIIVITTSVLNAQDYKFGKVSKEELNERVYAADSSASAAVLYRTKKLRYEYIQAIGFKLVTYVHERIKIYNSDGFEYATISELLYKSGSDKETISNLKAHTFNIVNGSIEKTKMDKSGVFSTSLSESRNEEKFTLPNLKEGSVIEYQYRINSPFYYYMDEIDLQYDIPILKQEIVIETPEYFTFKPNIKGYLSIAPQLGRKTGKINFVSKTRQSGSNVTSSFENSAIDYQINTATYALDNVPALKEEPYVNDMNNYRSAVNYELQYVQFPQSLREDYAITWEEVVRKIYANTRFGSQLKLNRYYKDDLEAITSVPSSEGEMAMAIFVHVKNKMTWNSNYGYYAEKGVKEAYKENSGNIADINLILTSMLQSAGLDANPVLVSTRNHGVPMFPTREGFNYVIASVQIDGGTVLLDASNKFTKPNLLPTRALNWYGKLIKKDGTFSTVNLLPKKISKKNISMNVNLNANGDIEGKSRTTYTDYEAYLFRNRNTSTKEDEYLEKLENKNEGMEIDEYSIKNKMTIGKPIMESFAFKLDAQADVIGDKIYFAPMFHLTTTENPFKLEERKYPIDFTYPMQKQYMLNIFMPEGYHLSSKPDDINMVMIDKIAGFKYAIKQNGNSLQVLVDFKINQAIISAVHYADLKEFFKNTIEKQTEKIVLSKNLTR